MLAVVLPDTSEVWLVRDLWRNFVWEDDIVLFKNLWCKFAKSIPLLLELLTAFSCSCINAEDYWLLLIAMSKGVENSVSFAFVIGIVEHVTTVSPSSWVGNFIVEESA